MTTPTHYLTIETSGTANFDDRGSKFIGYAFPVKSPQEFKQLLSELKKQHPKATHHCFAYRLGLDGSQFRVSDDGEPSDSAGRPILGQIDSKGLTDVLVVVVRYFGGTLLGVPGLINAYRSAAALALQVTPSVRKVVEKKLELEFDYTRMNDVMKIVKRFGCTIYKQEAQLFCTLVIGVAVECYQDFLKQSREIEGLTVGAER